MKNFGKVDEINVEYDKYVTPLETPQSESLSRQTIPRTLDQTVKRTSVGRRDPEIGVPTPDETHPEQEQKKNIL